MGLQNNNTNGTYVHISNGKLVVKENGEQVFYDQLTGVITNVEFVIEEYNQKQFEVVRFTLQDGDDKYILKIRTDSGYFRGFVNALKMANITQPIVVSPSSKEENGKTRTTCFLRQNGKPLKHAFTKDNMGDLPQVERVTLNGIEHWDSTKQLMYWKTWLMSITWQLNNENRHKQDGVNTTITQDEFNELDAIDDDLPF
jgi:hypothetical protein